MMKTGTIVKVDSTYAVVLSDEGKPEKINYKLGMSLGQKVYYFKEDVYTIKSKIMKMSALVASLLIVILVATLLDFGGTTSNAKPYAIVTVDINPSVEIELDTDNIVMKVTNLNDAATDIISNNMIGMNIEDALELLLNNAQVKGFLLEDGSILISSVILEEDEDTTVDAATDDEDTTEEESALEERIQAFMEKKTEQYNFLYVKGTDEALKAANSQGLSLGKFEMLKFLDDDITQEEIKEMKVAAIAERKEIIELNKSEKRALKIIRKNQSEDSTEDSTEDELQDAEKVTFEDDINTEDTTDEFIPSTKNNSNLKSNSKKNDASIENEKKDKAVDITTDKNKVITHNDNDDDKDSLNDENTNKNMKDKNDDVNDSLLKNNKNKKDDTKENSNDNDNQTNGSKKN